MSNLISLPTIPWQTIDLTNKIERLKSSVESTKVAPQTKSSSELKKACSEFESLFLYYLFKQMRTSIPKSGLISGGMAEAIYTSMLDYQLAKELSLKGGIGLSSLLIDHLDSNTSVD
jgi:flagellar protein FlgJ